MKKNITEKRIDSTFDEPQSTQAINFQNKFDKTMAIHGINLSEVDKQLNEKEQSLKKKIFSLSKMEALVFSDPKLSAVYDEMAENGEEKYGYHYNETIMNIIFNDYVLNSSKYLQKYKKAVPKKKKRRDKSGIEALKKDTKDIKKREKELKKEKENESINETTGAAKAGAYSTKAGDNTNYEANDLSDGKEWKKLIDAEIAEIAKEMKMKDKKKKKKKAKPVDKTNFVGGSSAKPSWKGGKIVDNPNNNLNESHMDSLNNAKQKAQKISKEDDVVQHVNQISDDNYEVSDWYDTDKTIVSYEGGRELDENKLNESHLETREDKIDFIKKHTDKIAPSNYPESGKSIYDWLNGLNDKSIDRIYKNIEDKLGVDETTTASSSGAYVGPAMWGSGDLMNGGKEKKKDKKPYWKGGEMIKEGNYLTNSNGFEKYYNMLTEGKNLDISEIKKQLEGTEIKSLEHEGMVYVENGIAYSADDQQPLNLNDQGWRNLYNEYFENEFGIHPDTMKDDNDTFSWDQLSSMGLIENGDMNEHHLETKDQKIRFIMNNMEDTMPIEILNDMSDEDIDTLYQQLESEMGLNENLNRDDIIGFDKIMSQLNTMGAFDYDLFNDVCEKNNIDGVTLINMIANERKKQSDKASLNEKSKSKSQQQAAGMALAAKRGEMDVEDLKGAAKQMYDSMNTDDLEDFAETEHEGLPKHVDENKENLVDFDIPEWAMSALINDDRSGLSDEDEAKLDEFINDVANQYGNAHFLLGDIDGEDNLGFKHSNDIDNLGSDVYRVYINPSKQLNEKSESEEQRKAAGAALAAKRGEMNANELYGAAKDMYNSMSEDDLEDYASGVKENQNENMEINEHHLSTKEDKMKFIMKADELLTGTQRPENKFLEYLNKLNDEKLHNLYLRYENKLKKEGYDPTEIDINQKSKLDEHHLENNEDKINYIKKVAPLLMPTTMVDSYIELLKNSSDDMIHDAYLKAEDMLRNKGIDPEKITETMIDNQEDSMKLDPNPINVDAGSDMPKGMQSSGSMGESKKNKNIMKESNEYLEKLNKDLKLIEMHQNKLEEDRKTSSLVMKDRYGKENEKNFKQDLKHSGTKDIIDTTKELEWKDQQTEVGKDPQKLGKDIEKQHMKNTKGDSFENKGNSTNNDGNEIPKRNLTDDEADEVDLYRKGLGDFVYDNEPSERYKERMKRDMGEKNYKKRQDRLDFQAKAPMYNKDSTPVDDGIEKVQYDKDKSKWNSRMGIKESTLTGKYTDEMGKTRIFDFSTLNVQEINDLKNNKNGAFFKMDMTGLGNSYDKKGQILENITTAINEWEFYTDGNKNVFAYKPIKKLNENKEKNNKKNVNEEFNKMKHLLNYKPKDFIDTKKNKL